MLMAGATVVGVGSAVYYRGPQAITTIVAEMVAWLESHQRADLEVCTRRSPSRTHLHQCPNRRPHSSRPLTTATVQRAMGGSARACTKYPVRRSS